MNHDTATRLHEMTGSKASRRFAHCVATVLSFLIGTVAAAGELQVTVHHPADTAGKVFVALFDGRAAFAANKPFKSRIVDIQGTTTVLKFEDLADGSYALTVFADTNGNGKLDTNFVGMPTERYGFSNDARGFMGPPDFDAAAIRVVGPARSTEVTLR